jgi:hypothetical protein
MGRSRVVAAEEMKEIAGAPGSGAFADLCEAGVGAAALDPRIDAERLAEPELERQHPEAAALGEEPGEPLADESVLLDEVRAFADGDDAGVADEGA